MIEDYIEFILNLILVRTALHLKGTIYPFRSLKAMQTNKDMKHETISFYTQ